MTADVPEKNYPQPTNQDLLSYYVYQEEWKPTRPLRPIGAMQISPGPAIVNLPPTIGEDGHDLSRPKAPGYKIGQRLPFGSTYGQKQTGPGPGTYDIREVTNKGKENCKAPKIGKSSRSSDTDTLVAASPGPAAYDRQPGDRIIYPKGPSFSMGSSERGKMKATTTPGPNAYFLPPFIGLGKTPYVVGPSYSAGKAERMPEKRQQQNPGPAAYLLPSSNIHMSKGPAFSMGSKAAPPSGTKVSSAGLPLYASHLVKFDKYSTPRITFGIRHSPYKAMPGFAAEK